MKYFRDFHDKYPKQMINWVNNQNWKEFRDIQKSAIKLIPINEKEVLNDLILTSDTASGKTEAVYIPLITRLINKYEKSQDGLFILYISPLRALINDQYNRLGRSDDDHSLSSTFKVNFVKWHSGGDTNKTDIHNIKNGILLTTPESIESFFVNHSSETSVLTYFSNIEAIVIDELHAYFDNARGRHLQSLLTRIDNRVGRDIPRIALSATLGSAIAEASSFIRPKYNRNPDIITVPNRKGSSNITLKVFLDDTNESSEKKLDKTYESMVKEIKKDFSKLDRGLIFANSRAEVELLHEKINSMLKNQFNEGEITPFARHYSNLSAQERNEVEKAMRSESDNISFDKMTTICTNTLELGIDIGKVSKVGQIDPTFSVASLRQRIGRSGRRNNTPDGVVYIIEKLTTRDDHILDKLQLRTFQAAAAINLAIEGQFESPTECDLHLSTLVHQILSLIHENDSISTRKIYNLLINYGPWDNQVITFRFFERLLESLEELKNPLLCKNSEGDWTFPPSENKRRPVYAIFKTPQQYSVVYHNKQIGQLPMTVQYKPGDTFVLNRGRWRVITINDKMRILVVIKVPQADAPRFGGLAQAPSEMIVKEMYQLYTNNKKFNGISESDTQRSIKIGKDVFNKLNLERNKIIANGNDVIIFPFCGHKKMQTLLLLLRREGLHAEISSFAIHIEKIAIKDVLHVIKQLIKNNEAIAIDELAREAQQLCSDRYDYFLSPYHKRLAFAHKYLDINNIVVLMKALL